MINIDNGILQVDIERFLKQRLPVATFLKKKVESNQKLNEFDLDFLENMLKEVQQMLPIYNRHKDYQHLASKIMNLYENIIAKAMENEKSRAN